MYGPDRGTWGVMVAFMFMGVTLGVWKLIEILAWLVMNVRIVW